MFDSSHFIIAKALENCKYFYYNKRKKGGGILTVEGIVSAISTIGFPIVCCLVLGWYVKYITDKNREEINKLNEQHKAEMTDVTQAINNNTLVMQKLIDSLGKDESEVTSE